MEPHPTAVGPASSVTGPLALPQSSMVQDVLDLVKRTESAALANHSIRSYLFARLYATHGGLRAGQDYDPELLFFACALHDIGLTEEANHAQRFEVDGADFAADFLTQQGLKPAQVDVVWQAIALNTSIGIAEKRGPIPALTLAGVSVDFLGAPYIDEETAAAIHQAYPRHSIGRVLTDAVVAQVGAKPSKAPLWSMPAQLFHERSVPPHLTSAEQLANEGRWGE